MQQAQAGRQRLACLDGLRGALALGVVAIHAGQQIGYPLPAQALVAALGDGGLAVALFFVLSGLVIFNSIESFKGRPVPFLVARAARIYPVYLIALAVSLPFAATLASLPGHVAAHVAMVHGMFPADTFRGVLLSIPPPAWSLSVEWQFYLMAILAVMATGLRRWPVTVLLMLAGLAGVWLGAGFTPGFLLNNAHYFALGIATSALFPLRSRWGWAGFAAATACCVGILVLRGVAPRMLVPVGWLAVIGAQVWPRGPLRPVGAVLRSGPLQWLGRVSYSLYLIHFPILLMLASLWRPAGAAVLLHWLWIALAFCLSFIAADGLQRLVETPCTRWGHRVTRRAA